MVDAWIFNLSHIDIIDYLLSFKESIKKSSQKVFQVNKKVLLRPVQTDLDHVKKRLRIRVCVECKVKGLVLDTMITTIPKW